MHGQKNKIFGNALSESGKQEKLRQLALRLPACTPLNKNIFEDFDFDAETEDHNPCAGALLSRKESAAKTGSKCAFS
jgi:hypothetical protein